MGQRYFRTFDHVTRLLLVEHQTAPGQAQWLAARGFCFKRVYPGVLLIAARSRRSGDVCSLSTRRVDHMPTSFESGSSRLY